MKEQRIIKQQVIEINNDASIFSINIYELWSYRDLFLTLAWKDICLRYKQTLFGVAWAVIQPTIAMIIFTVVFSKMAKIPTDNVPAPLFFYSGLIAWTFFSQTVSGASQSLIEGSRLITKVYFPRIIIPLSVTGYTFLNFIISSILQVVLFIVYGIWPSESVILLPILYILLFITSVGVGTLLAGLNAKYRDFCYVVPFLLQIWMFASPVAYSANLIPCEWQLYACLNPMVGIIDGFRCCLLGEWPDTLHLIISGVIGFIIFLLSIIYFNKLDNELADIL